jgi:hypothetical protein
MEVMEKIGKSESQRKTDEHGNKGLEIYESIREQYEPQYNGKFLVINTESKEVVISETLDDAMYFAEREVKERGLVESPFFALKIGEIFVGQIFSLTTKT